MVVYADDAAIIVSSDHGPEHLEYCIQVCVSSFREIANLLGGELEPSKTEVLAPMNRSWSHVKSIDGEGIAVVLNHSVRWLGYYLSITSNGQIRVNIPDGKVFALHHSIKIFRSYNDIAEDCRRFFMTFFRPVIDLWLFIPSLHTGISKIEARLIK